MPIRDLIWNGTTFDTIEADTVDTKHAAAFSLTTHNHDGKYYSSTNKPAPADIGAIAVSASCNKNWNWNGQAGQPSWLWGGNDGTNMYVYNPSKFSVANADTVDGVHLHPGNDVPLISNPSPYVYAFKGGDDHNCYVKNLGDVTVGNANRLEGNPASNFVKTTGGSMSSLMLTDYGTPFECGQYIDFHEIGSNVDYSTRLWSGAGILNTTGGLNAGNSNGNLKRTTISTAAPSGGVNGDIWIQYS